MERCRYAGARVGGSGTAVVAVRSRVRRRVRALPEWLGRAVGPAIPALCAGVWSLSGPIGGESDHTPPRRRPDETRHSCPAWEAGTGDQRGERPKVRHMCWRNGRSPTRHELALRTSSSGRRKPVGHRPFLGVPARSQKLELLCAARRRDAEIHEAAGVLDRRAREVRIWAERAREGPMQPTSGPQRETEGATALGPGDHPATSLDRSAPSRACIENGLALAGPAENEPAMRHQDFVAAAGGDQGGTTDDSQVARVEVAYGARRVPYLIAERLLHTCMPVEVNEDGTRIRAYTHEPAPPDSVERVGLGVIRRATSGHRQQLRMTGDDQPRG